MSNLMLQQCLAVNEVAGKTPNPEIPFSWDRAENQMQLIESETFETRKAIQQQDFDGFVDGCADILMVTLGQAAVNNMDIGAAFTEMTNKLMTRFDRTIDAAEETRKKYEELGVETDLRTFTKDGQIYYITVSARDQGPEYPAGKFLKSVYMQKPNYGAVIETMAQCGVEPLSHRLVEQTQKYVVGQLLHETFIHPDIDLKPNSTVRVPVPFNPSFDTQTKGRFVEIQVKEITLEPWG